MTSIRLPHVPAPAQRAYEIKVTSSVGEPVALRVRGMKGSGANTALPQQPRSSVLGGAVKTALEPAVRLSAANTTTTAHVARLTPHAAVLEAPWSVHHMAAAVQELPDALRGALIRGAGLVLGPRLASLALPTATLVATLYSPSVGDASLPFVPMRPKGRADVDGFNPLGPNDPVRRGIPGTEYTRPHTPMVRELPASATAEPQRLEGGPSVDVQPLPGRAWHAPNASDYVFLSDGKTKLTFSDVVITPLKDPRVAQGGGVHLNFHAGEDGEGKISIGWVDPAYRQYVAVDIEKSAQLPDRLVGEILARALGHENGFIPRNGLWLRVTDLESRAPATQDTALTIGRWAMALHGQQANIADSTMKADGHFFLAVGPVFRATSHFFENPSVSSGARGDGPGLAEPAIFLNLEPTEGDAASQPRVTSAKQFAQAVNNSNSQNLRMGDDPKNYVIPIPFSAQGAVEPIISNPHLGHPLIAQGQPVFGAGTFRPVYDPDGGSGKLKVQWLTDHSGHYKPFGLQAKRATEQAFQEAGLDVGLRFFSIGKPVSTEPFAGLTVQRKISSASSVAYEIRIPDARALEAKGSVKELDPKSEAFPDLASLVLEPMADQPGWVRVRNLELADDMDRFLPTLIGQALSAVSLEQPFKGLVVSPEYWEREDSSDWREGDFADGLTIYGQDQKLGEFSPEVPFVLKRHMDSGEVGFFINPEVLIKR